MSVSGVRVAGANLLTISEVSIQFRGVRALDGVSLTVEEGSVTALIGPNGAGKTTLFNCVSGLVRPQGQIVVNGADISHAPPHARASLGIARTFQTPALIDGQSVLDSVLLGDYSRGPHGPSAMFTRPLRMLRDAGVARSDARDLLQSFGLWGDRHRDVDALPHAQRRRVEIVRCLLASPRLLLLDEPAAGLGPEESLPLFEQVRSWATNAGATILLVEHSMELVMQVATHIIVLDAGRVLAEGSPESVRSDPRVVEAYLGE